ncbi:Homoserine kinase [Buchnera aphidicola (Tetraneura ulmi)]|uniref:homoserine kinase n=1 Tax=Buchnera aphidicola TaxID=9 RepID=UPI00346449FC
MIKIYSPASIGNIGVGFDVLGAAIEPIDGTNLGDKISISSSNCFKLVNTGTFKHQLPKKVEDNVVYKCWELFCKKIKKNIPIKIVLEKNMPIGSGLGSSACSIVGTMTALNEFSKTNKLSNKELIILMGQLEGNLSGNIHYDNVYPCYSGGIQIIIQKDDIIGQNIPYFKNWLWIVAWPGINISTFQSRSILPNTYSNSTCIQHSRNLATFIHASYTNQEILAAKSIKDIIAEPYRMKLLPNFKKVKSMVKKDGAISCGISGSGPSFFAISQDIKTAKKIASTLKKNYVNKDKGFVYICKIDQKGTRKIG